MKDLTFQTPPGLLVVGGEAEDPFDICLHGVRKQLKFIDFANAHSCSFIATQDVGEVVDSRTFKITGRLNNADLRGCNLMYV
jgi:hypothetical protein